MVYMRRATPVTPRPSCSSPRTRGFDLGRIVEEFRRAGGDEVAAIAKRLYGGDSRSVSSAEWGPLLEALRPVGAG
ncbi:MAG TPA: hypothetical protein VE596_17730 [Gaiellaceae bacterium]|jgi:hypothetical protein|nr:hypothetical protein [Gaiellaceae bacterium]